MTETRTTYETDATPAPNPAEQWGIALMQATRDAMISNSGLPTAAQTRLRSMDFQTPDEVTAAIELQRQILADLHEDDVVQVGDVPPRGSQITLGRNSIEQVDAAFAALLEGVNPPDGVRPLSGIREL